MRSMKKKQFHLKDQNCRYQLVPLTGEHLQLFLVGLLSLLFGKSILYICALPQGGNFFQTYPSKRGKQFVEDLLANSKFNMYELLKYCENFEGFFLAKVSRPQLKIYGQLRSTMVIMLLHCTAQCKIEAL